MGVYVSVGVGSGVSVGMGVAVGMGVKVGVGVGGPGTCAGSSGVMCSIDWKVVPPSMVRSTQSCAVPA